MQIADPRAGFDFCNGRLLRIENNLINLALARGELPGHRIRTRHIRTVPAVFGADIHDDHVACLHAPCIVVVMKDCRERTGAHDRRITRPLRSIACELVFQRGLDLVLHRARRNHTGCRMMRLQRYLDGLVQQRDFCRRFDLPQISDIALNVLQTKYRF